MHEEHKEQEQHELPERISERLTELESLFTHLERTVHDLNGVVLEQQAQLDAFKRELARLGGQIADLAQSLPDERDPLAERPPHW